MTNEQIRIKIAESIGWKKYNVTLLGWKGWIAPDGHKYPQGGDPYPNYHKDLNACAEFRKGLTEFEKREFITILEHIVNRRLKISAGDSGGWHFALVDSLPIEQCESYLRTIGQWEDGQ